jgi:hypothetical protein
MTTIGITGMGLTGVMRMTWVDDDLAHVLDHSHADETSGTWAGQACPAHGLPLGSDVDGAVLRRLVGQGQIADLTWEAPADLTAEHAQVFQSAIQAYNAADTEHAEQLWEKLQAIWSQAWSANYAALELLQQTGLTQLSPARPQQWVIASFEHHCSPHGLPHPPHPQHRHPRPGNSREATLTPASPHRSANVRRCSLARSSSASSGPR